MDHCHRRKCMRAASRLFFSKAHVNKLLSAGSNFQLAFEFPARFIFQIRVPMQILQSAHVCLTHLMWRFHSSPGSSGRRMRKRRSLMNIASSTPKMYASPERIHETCKATQESGVDGRARRTWECWGGAAAPGAENHFGFLTVQKLNRILSGSVRQSRFPVSVLTLARGRRINSGRPTTTTTVSWGGIICEEDATLPKYARIEGGEDGVRASGPQFRASIT